MGVTLLSVIQQAQEIAGHVIEDLLGPGVVMADEKTKSTALQQSSLST